MSFEPPPARRTLYKKYLTLCVSVLGYINNLGAKSAIVRLYL